MGSPPGRRSGTAHATRYGHYTATPLPCLSGCQPPPAGEIPDPGDRSHARSQPGTACHQHPLDLTAGRRGGGEDGAQPAPAARGLSGAAGQLPDNCWGGIRTCSLEVQGLGRRSGGCKSPDLSVSEFKGRPIQIRHDMTGSGLADNPCSVCNKSCCFPLSGLQFIN